MSTSNGKQAPRDRSPGLRKRMQVETRRISSQHVQLDELYSLVVDALGNGAVHSARVAFSRFEDALRAHLEIEESLYFPALRELAPAAAEAIRGLVEEHAAFYHECQRIRMLLRAGEHELSFEQLERIAESLADHERREEELAARASKSRARRRS